MESVWNVDCFKADTESERQKERKIEKVVVLKYMRLQILQLPPLDRYIVNTRLNTKRSNYKIKRFRKIVNFNCNEM